MTPYKRSEVRVCPLPEIRTAMEHPLIESKQSPSLSYSVDSFFSDVFIEPMSSRDFTNF